QRARTIGSLLRSVSSFMIYGIAFIMVLAEFGVDVAPILASAGVLGLAIGFGAQNLVRDFLSGIFMMLEDQYGVGDTVDLGEATGDVEAVGLRITTIRDITGTVWYVRNGEILRVGNFSKGFAIAVVDVPLAHQADIDRAGELTEQAAHDVAAGEHADDVIAPPELLGVQSVTPYAVTLRLTVKTKPGHQWKVQRALNTRVQSALSTAGVPAPAVATLPAPR
ncbi:MAG: mechanosensitive ion channel family protein, partial [Pseudonocardiaceae bacterium]